MNDVAFAVKDLPVFVIAFPDADKRRAIRQRLASAGIEPRFFDAVAGATLPEAALRPFLESGREYWFDGPMRAGAIGCALSHIGIWQTMVEEGIDSAVILEDDATPMAGVAELIPDRLRQLARQADQMDLVFLSARFNKRQIRVDGGTGAAPGLTLPRYSDIGTESYFITRRAAAYFLTKPGRFRFEVDLFLHHWWRHRQDIQILHHTPPLFEEDASPTRINYSEIPRYASTGLHHRVARRFNRARDSLLKRWRFAGYVDAARRRLRASPQRVQE